MIRVIETPNFMKRIVYDEEMNPVMDGDNVVTEDVLMYTMVETYEVGSELNLDGEQVETLILTEKRRVMPNGDYYVVDGNVELYVPLVTPKRIVTENEKYQDMVNQLMEAYLASFTM